MLQSLFDYNVNIVHLENVNQETVAANFIMVLNVMATELTIPHAVTPFPTAHL
jgi:hypothetical protein